MDIWPRLKAPIRFTNFTTVAKLLFLLNACLDDCYEGFPFEEGDDILERRRNGIRAHLDDLALRHPEFAEHLFGSLWDNALFHDSPLRERCRRRDSNSNGGQGNQSQVDEDASSQASGSSAASGASTISSHSGEPDASISSIPLSSIPQYGLRNTVNIGRQQRRTEMENSEKNERSQRSMSAPPENRHQQCEQQQQQSWQQQQPQQQPMGQRFVSRVDITPQGNQQQRTQSSKPPSSNVRQIPIFVEGRDEPVISKMTDKTPASSFQHQPSPPHFHKPSHFNEHFTRQHEWPTSHFQNFYEPTSFDQPTMRRQQFQQPQYHYQQQQPQYYHQQYQQQPHHQQQPQYQHQSQEQQQHQQPQQSQQQSQQSQQQQEILKSKFLVPKDPLERVAEVQKEVDDLAERVHCYVGGSRQDKEYVYLDEMLTRELIKLDDIETEGRENVRQARKNAIKSIQDTISLLETKAPVVGQQVQSRVDKKAYEEKNQQDIPQTEPMEIDTKQEKQNNEPIPLPPAPSSPTTRETETSENKNIMATTNAVSTEQYAASDKQDTEKININLEQKIKDHAVENMEPKSIAPISISDKQHLEKTIKELKTSEKKNEEKNANDAMQKKDATMITAEKQAIEEMKESGKLEVDRKNQTESPRLQKKTKKTKKQQQQQLQQPVSEQAIPLPPPPSTESAK